MSTDRLANILHRVATEELSDDQLVEILGRVARGETTLRKYKVYQMDGVDVHRLSSVTVKTTPADQARGLLMISRMKGMDGLGLSKKELKNDPTEAIRLYTQDGEYDDIVWDKNRKNTLVVEPSNCIETKSDETKEG